VGQIRFYQSTEKIDQLIEGLIKVLTKYENITRNKVQKYNRHNNDGDTELEDFYVDQFIVLVTLLEEKSVNLFYYLLTLFIFIQK
jgi:hypothetical protein